MLVSLNVENSSYKKQSNPNLKQSSETFKGIGNLITQGLIASDKSPMVGVSIIDLTSMITPRTIIDATRNGFAATETFLRESAGLIINCLIPGVVVLGAGKLVQRLVMGKDFAGLQSHKIWANQATNEALTSAWLGTKGGNTERISSFVDSLNQIEVLSGKNNWVPISGLKDNKALLQGIKDAIGKNDKKLVEQATDKLIEQLGGSRNIKFADGVLPHSALSGIKKLDISSSNIKNLTRDMNDMANTFIKMNDNQIAAFSKKLTKLINTKSFLGLAAIAALGASFQAFNRYITKMRTGSSGFVGEIDYPKKPSFGETHQHKLTHEERKKLNFHKMLSVMGLAALALASFGKRPSVGMFQFNGILPTLNQCRAITLFTFGGRLVSSESENELKETRLRDFLGFINLYYLGDYVAKAAATWKERNPAFKGKLLNETKKFDPNSSFIDKFWHWFKHTELKGFEEVANNPALKKARAFSQASGLIYSCIVLGLLIPMYNKYKTYKNGREKQMLRAQKLQEQENNNQSPGLSTQKKEIYQAFFRANQHQRQS
ncbi:MAG: hypothetical protein PHX18_03215 [Candidatus Gastranaerophilales bacterium]|nr:hypothetical protein [Candidatus Gastranaerophilales bacterium]